ncbi:MAG: cation transporter [Ndongobacter sp.]|nr:cation transporter [Ndongobacter sp.]
MKKSYQLKHLGCANCARKMGEAIGKIDGVSSATVNFVLSRLSVEAEEGKMPSKERMQEVIRAIEPECELI